MQKPRLQLSEQTLRGLYFLHKYRFLTISQFAKVSGYSLDHARELLRGLAKHKAVGFIGYEPTGGHGRTPKVYYPELKAWQYLMLESRYEDIGEFVPHPPDLNWTPEMFHRLKIIDLFLSLEAALDSREHIELIKIFLSYRRIRHTLQRETTDYVGNPASQTRIVPDGVFMLKNHQTGNSGLFILEADMGTERLTAPKSRNQRSTIKGKFELYDQYLQSGRFATTYEQWGQFRSFLLLFVAQAPDRVENIRQASAVLTSRLHPYYRLGVFSQVSEDFLGPVWLSRDPSVTLRYALVSPA